MDLTEYVQEAYLRLSEQGLSMRDITDELMVDPLVDSLYDLHVKVAKRGVVADVVRSAHGRHRQQARRSVFSTSDTAARAADDGRPATTLFDARYAVRGSLKRLADMTASDHRAVAARYRAQGVSNLVYALWHDRVADRIGDRTTGEALAEPEAAALLRAAKDELIPDPS